ncbi:MAG: transposase, partial [Pseudomonadota bacterium]
MTQSEKGTVATIEEAKALLAERDAELAKLREENEQLRHNVEAYRRMAFGPSSEKRRAAGSREVDAQQGWLFHQTVVAEAFETAERKGIDATICYAGPAKQKPRGGRRKKFPEHTPEMTTRYELPEDQRVCTCGSPLHEMGVETCRELERIEITFVHNIERVKYACRGCEEGVRTAPGPDRPFEKGLLGRGFLGHLVLERFGHHMPYHRLEKKFAGEGLDVCRSTQERSMARCAERLAPLYDLLCEQVRGANVIFTDDTPVTIAQPRGGGSSKKGRVWIYLDREGRHAYDFTESRSQDGPLEWLTGF